MLRETSVASEQSADSDGAMLAPSTSCEGPSTSRMNAIFADLCERGFSIQTGVADLEMKAIATLLGQPCPSRWAGPVFELLRPTHEASARPASLSATFGLGAFPLHSDTAHWRRPARYVLLRAPSSCARATLLVDVLPLLKDDAQAEDILSRGVFVAVDGRRSFLTNLWWRTRGCFRFDPVCLRPLDRTAQYGRALLERYLAHGPVVTIDWAANTLVVIDNWRCVHGRGPGSIDEHNSSGSRTLVRALVMGDK